MQDTEWSDTATAALAGVVVATLLALLPPAWPALAIAAGAVATLAVLVVRGSGRRRYAAAGTAFCLGFAVVTWVGWPVPPAYTDSPRLALATLGAASAVAVAVQLALARLFRRFFRSLIRRSRRASLSAARTLAKLLGLLRSAVGLLGRFSRVGAIVVAAVAVVVVVGIAGFVLNGLGVELLVPWLGGDVDAVVLAFVGAVLVGFHALDAAQSTWIATREGVDAGRTAGSRVARTVRRYREESGPEERAEE